MSSKFQLRASKNISVQANITHLDRKTVSCLAVLPLALLAAGCSSKPGPADIEAALAAAYDCPVLEVRDVKKLNGEPGPQGTYNVDFSYTVAIKGGEAAAAKLLTDWVYLRNEAAAATKAGDTLYRGTFTGGVSKGDPRIKAVDAYSDHVREELGKLVPCGGAEILAVVMPMYEQAKESFKAASGTIAFPTGAQLARPGTLRKSENGWYFVAIAPGFSRFEMVNARPVAAALPPSKVPELMGQPSGGEQTLTGTIRVGTADSCLAVGGGDGKCYGLPSEPAQAKRILDVCNDGDQCTITGQFDDKAESLGAFSKVEKFAR